MRDDYLIEYAEVENTSIGDFLEKIEGRRGKTLIDCKLSELSFFNGAPIEPGNGVYIFRHNKNYIYVGKCRAQSFTERIGNHFDLRHGAWMNGMIKALVHKGSEHGYHPADLLDASKIAFENFNFILINFHNWQRIDRTETLLRAYTSPLNKFRTKRETDKTRLVRDY